MPQEILTIEEMEQLFGGDTSGTPDPTPSDLDVTPPPPVYQSKVGYGN